MLKLSTKSRYGLRAMIHLARSYGSGPLLMSEIAKSESLSRKYLHTLLTSLRQQGLVLSVRGTKGGFELAKPPEEIPICAVFEALEGRIAVVDCLRDADLCARSDGCVARDMWSRVNTAILETLSGTTLDALAKIEKDDGCSLVDCFGDFRKRREIELSGSRGALGNM